MTGGVPDFFLIGEAVFFSSFVYHVGSRARVWYAELCIPRREPDCQPRSNHGVFLNMRSEQKWSVSIQASKQVGFSRRPGGTERGGGRQRVCV